MSAPRSKLRHCTCRVCVSRTIFQARRHLLRGRVEIAADILNSLMCQLAWEAMTPEIVQAGPPLKCEGGRCRVCQGDAP